MEAVETPEPPIASAENRFITTSRDSINFTEAQSAIPRTPPGTVANRRLVTNSSIESTHKVFGVSLEDLYIRDNSTVPIFVLSCIEFIEAHALKLKGIYNVSGSARFLRNFTHVIDESMHFSNDMVFTAIEISG